MSKIGQWALENLPDDGRESKNESAATRQMEADGCHSLPDLEPLRHPDHINDGPIF